MIDKDLDKYMGISPSSYYVELDGGLGESEMVRSIRLWRGDWVKNGEQGWDFIPDPTDFGFRMLISRSSSVGSKSVAEYQFLCRTRFAIGSTTYVFDETADAGSRMAYENLVLSDRAATTERVMNEIFTEEEMVIFHRVSLEMAYADSILAQEPRVNQPVREIIELDDDEDEMVDGNQCTNVTG
ncbi:hypothetical protein Bca52824_085935 [Brassica carinata]|uniref:Uncharacterized protein n=1 Tax=Brassica carinata TaxID=52824 RepID=A0A8X7P8P1_BRACI|nr:hypothetical protein Bca52824_085935 [Brassica carinata]